MASRLIQSLFWFCGVSGLGYGLYLVTTPSKESVKEISKDYPGIEKNPLNVRNKSQQFVDVLEAASTSDKPLYRMTQKELQNLSKK